MLSSILHEAVRGGASRVALAGRRTKFTYGQLWNSTRQLVRTLNERGVGPGCRVCLLTDDVAQWAVGFFAVASVGAVIQVCSPVADTTQPESVSQSDVDFVLLPAAATPADRLRASQMGAPIIPMPARASLKDKPAHSRLRQLGAVFAEGGGHSSHSVLRSQSNLVLEAKSLVRAFNLIETDRILCTLQVDRSPGLCVGLLAAVQARATLVNSPLEDRGAFEESFVRHHPTVLITDLSTLAAPIAESLRIHDAFKNVRLVVAPRSNMLAQAVEARPWLAGRLATFYHRAETGVIAINTHGGASDCVGRPLPGVHVFLEKGWDMSKQTAGSSWNFGSFMCFRTIPRIFRDGAIQVNEPGISGRIVVESPTAASTQDGWSYTADHGYFDAHGDLHVLPDVPAPSVPRVRCA